jgi:DNA-binding transcriptional LysR family regulator
VDVRQLRYFLAVADELHFGRAAARLHIAQPALSQQVRALEAELGLQLLERGARGVTLTDAGARLREEALAVVARFDAAVATMARVRDGSVGTVRIGVFSGPVRLRLAAVLAELRRVHPDVEIQTVHMSARAQEAALRNGALEIALLPWAPASPLDSRVIERRPLGVALPAEHPLAARGSVSPAELRSLALVWMGRSSDPDLYDAILRKLDAAGGRPASVLEATTPESSLSIVAAGVAASLKTREEVEVAVAAGERVVWMPLVGVDLEIATVVAWNPARAGRARDAILEILTR